MHIHPINIYTRVESHLGHLNHIILNRIPQTAINVTSENIIHPLVPFKAIRQSGVYEPAINMYIIEWSSLCKKFITFLEAITKWYVAEVEYKSIRLIPYIITATICTDPEIAPVVLISMAINAIKDKTAPNKWVSPLIGSLM